MALIALPRPIWWPEFLRTAGGDPTGEIGVTALNGPGHRFGYVFSVPKAGEWEGFGFRTGSVTTATDTDARAESLNSATVPTGTLLTPGAQVTIASGSLTAATWIEAIFGTPPAVAFNDRVGAVLATSGTPNWQTANRIARYLEGFWPAGRHHNGTAWVTGFLNTLIFAVRIDGVWVPLPGAFPLASHQHVLFRSGQNPSEVGVYLTPEHTMRTTGFLLGGWSFMSDGATAVVRLRALDNTVIAESDVQSGGMRAGLGSNASQLRGWWTAPATLQAGTTYRFVAEGTSTTDNCRLQFMRIPSTAYATAVHQGAGHYRTQRAGTGAWSDTDTDYANLSLYVDAIEAGGGGEVLIPRRSTYFA